MPPQMKKAFESWANPEALIKIGAVVLPIVFALVSGGAWLNDRLSARLDSMDAKIGDLGRSMAVVDERTQKLSRDTDFLMRRQVAGRDVHNP